MTQLHKAGFVSIIGKPNVGKSTLMNELVGERISIITSKAQTTRHRILGIINGDDFQVIYSDTPGVLKPEYELHKNMMSFVYMSLEDSDVLLWVVESGEKELDELILQKIDRNGGKVILVVNKIDLTEAADLDTKIADWKEKHPFILEVVKVSALRKVNLDILFEKILSFLPEHEAYYPKDSLTDRPERFFVSEIIREKIFMTYNKEIPYCCQVMVESFKETDKIVKISATIYVERDSQKGIVIGHRGENLKKVGMMARETLEKFFDKQVFLETHVKVASDWRKNKEMLSKFGYES